MEKNIFNLQNVTSVWEPAEMIKHRLHVKGK